MKKTFAPLIASALIAGGCATPEMRAGWQQDAQDRCELSGIAANDPRRGACERVLVRQQNAQFEQQMGQIVAAGLLGAQASIERQQMIRAINAPRQVHMTVSRF